MTNSFPVLFIYMYVDQTIDCSVEYNITKNAEKVKWVDYKLARTQKWISK